MCAIPGISLAGFSLSFCSLPTLPLKGEGKGGVSERHLSLDLARPIDNGLKQMEVGGCSK